MTTDIKKYQFIDALRGIAILGVLLIHSAKFVPPHNPLLLSIMELGARGVQLFYIASAFTLCMSWDSRKNHEKTPIMNFYLRRFFRIAPMFYLAILLYIYLHGFSPRSEAPDGIAWWHLALTALFLHGLLPETINSVVPGGWSIAVEMSFYLILPSILLTFKTPMLRIVFLLISLALSFIAKPFFLWLFENNNLTADFIFLNFFSQLPVFAIGLICYSLYKNLHNMLWLVKLASIGFISIILIIKLQILPLPSKIIFNHIFISIGFGLFLLMLARYPSKILVNKLTVETGKISFSMYLTHFAILELFSRLNIDYLFTGIENTYSIIHYICIVMLTVAVSLLCYIFIEQNGISVGKNLIDRLEKRPSLS